MKRFILLFLLVCVSAAAFAQNKEGKSILYFKELSFGFALHTQGWTVFSDYGRIRDGHTKFIYEFEFSQVKHPKEYKQTQDFGISIQNYNSPKPYVYGKQNGFYLLNASVGKEKDIARKADKSGVSISLKYMAGVSLGLVKPYYLELLYPVDNVTYAIVSTRYSPESSDMFLDRTSIYGGTGFAHGLQETRIIPGVHTKLAVHFDWASYDEFVKAIEAGITFDAYYKEIPIMVLEKNQQFFPNLYASIQFGKKW